MSDIVAFEQFMKYLAPPARRAGTAEPLGSAREPGVRADRLRSVPYAERSSRLRISRRSCSRTSPPQHGAGSERRDHQGLAQGQDWRTAPLWGLGQRLFFLHDGRASDLPAAITDHASQGSEATGAVNNYNALPAQSKQDLLNFLRSL